METPDQYTARLRSLVNAMASRFSGLPTGYYLVFDDGDVSDVFNDQDAADSASFDYAQDGMSNTMIYVCGRYTAPEDLS